MNKLKIHSQLFPIKKLTKILLSTEETEKYINSLKAVENKNAQIL